MKKEQILYLIIRSSAYISSICIPPLFLHASEASSLSNDEALFVRRILEFWKDKENALVKSQIDQFLTQYPKSEYGDSLLVILGDIYWLEKNYEQALVAYQNIVKPQFQEKVFNNCLDCLYHLGRYQQVQQKLEGKILNELEQISDEQQALWVYYEGEALLNLAKLNLGSAESFNQLQQSKNCLLKLLTSPHKTNAKLGLAEIETLNGNPEKVVPYYLELADDIPEKKYEMLLKAAVTQAQYDPNSAIIELEKIQSLYGEYSSDAALKRVTLLFDQGKYEQIISEENEIYKALQTSRHPILRLFIGRSHFHLNHHQEALSCLQEIQKTEFSWLIEDSQVEKSIFVMMSASSHHLHHLEAIQILRTQFQQKFPDEPLLADIFFYEALTLAHHQKYEDAIKTLETVILLFPESPLKENVVFEKSIFQYKQGKWQESRTGFAHLIDNRSKFKSSAMAYMPFLSLKILEDAEKSGNQNTTQYREILVNDLKSALVSPEALNPTQKSKYLLQLGKTLYELEQYETALEALNNFIELYPKDENVFQAHLLSALCYQEGTKDSAKFAEHAEKVLIFKPDFSDRTRLHMSLFNTYLESAKTDDDAQKYYDLAADHLFSALQTKDKEQIRLDNQLWLGNHYYQKISKIQSEYESEPLTSPDLILLANQAAWVYDRALSRSIQFNKDNVSLELEYFKLSLLYGWLNKTQSQEEVLHLLVKAQNEQPQLQWKLRSRTLYAYADLMATIGKNEEALETYKKLIISLKPSDSALINISKLKWARLAFKTLPESQKTLNNSEMIAILKTLKDIYIHKMLDQEPVHLEAALDYIEIRTSLEPIEKRKEQQLFLLNRMKEDFNAGDDLWSKEYSESKLSNAEKNSLFERYMTLADAHIKRIQEKKDEAKDLYQSLLSDKDASKYLRFQAQSSLQQF